MALHTDADLKRALDLQKEDVEGQTKRSLGWRLPTVAIVALSITAGMIAWVINTKTVANKDVQIESIRHSTEIEKARIEKGVK